jgi:hypothetical protein
METVTKRDYFAGQALTGLLGPGPWSNEAIERVTRLAFQIADAMLAQSSESLPDSHSPA